MDIPTLFAYTVSYIKETILPTLTAQQKKVLVVALAIFTLLAATYLFSSYSFAAKPQINFEGKHDDEEEAVSMQPQIVFDDWGKIILRVNGEEKLFKDVVILPSDADGKQVAVEWNWKWQRNEKNEPIGMSHQPGIRIVDIEHYILSEEHQQPDVIILSQGRGHGGLRDNPGPGILQVEPEVEDYLKEKGIEFYILKTAAALEKYQQLLREGRKHVAVMIHTTC